jgi:nucleotide-binding universal stress UspA family protein
MKKILIALDYSQSAQKIAEVGYSLGKAMGAEITLLHVMEDSTYYSILEYPPVGDFMGFNHTEISRLFNNGQREAMLQFLDQTKRFLGDASIQTILKDGEFAETILNFAKEIQAGLIVMGSHSKGWLRNIVLGSITESVLRHTTIPLFIVPTEKTL